MISVFNTLVGRTTVPASQMTQLASYLVKSGSPISDGDAKTIITTRTHAQTAIAQIATRLAESQSGPGTFLRLMNVKSGEAIPEVLHYTHLPLDVAQMGAVAPDVQKALSYTPFADRVVMNVTQLVRQNGNVNDLTRLHGFITRAILSRSYFQAEGVWLATYLRFIGRSYSIILSSSVGTAYDLELFDRQAVMAVFGHYIYQQLGVRDPTETMVAQHRQLGYTSPMVVRDIGDLINAEAGSAPLTLVAACSLLGKLNIPRLKTADIRLLYHRFAMLGGDANTSALALEYPPAWVYLLLLCASGQKIDMQRHLNNAGLITENRQFSDQLSKDRILTV